MKQVEEEAQKLPASVAIDCRLGVGNSPVAFDPSRMSRAIINLLANAVKFTSRGFVKLQARVLREDAQTLELRFEVQDTGVGIDAAVLPRLFTAFEQADNSLTRRYGGTGLGLAITRRLAMLMGGSAGVQSQPGAGSTFWFTACLAHSGAAVPAEPAADASAPAAQPHWTGRRVLVAEDEPINREVTGQLLTDVGLLVEVHAAERGRRRLRATGAASNPDGA